MARRCSSMLAGWAWRESSPKCATAAIYPAGRLNDWVKKTCAQRETLTIAGFALDGSKLDGSISAGVRAKTWSMPARSTTASTRHRHRSAGASQAADPQNPALRKRIAHKGIWVEPELLAEIEYRAKSAEGKVRHPFFKGLREDL